MGKRKRSGGEEEEENSDPCRLARQVNEVERLDSEPGADETPASLLAGELG